MDAKEFAAKIKAKYPQYQGIDDNELTQKIIAKYPQYRSQVDVSPMPTAMGHAFQKAGIDPENKVSVYEATKAETGKVSPGEQALESMGQAGAKVTKGIENAVQPLANKGGLPGTLAATAAGTLAKTFLPQSKEDAAIQLATLPLMALGKGAQVAGKELGPLLEEGSKVIKPSPIDRVVGQFVTIRSAIPERYSSAVAADSSILSDKTPDVIEMGKRYTKAFQEAGMKVNSEELEKITGNPFPARDTELGKLQKIVLNAKNKLENNSLKENEAFIARSAAARIERSTAAQQNPQIRQVASGFKGAFDDFLVNSSLPNIKQLSRDYFRAIAKEYFQPWFPKNKNMSPNALRGYLMTIQAAKAAGNLATGNIPGALAEGAGVATSSPRMAGKLLQGYGALKGMAPEVPKISTPVRAVIPASLQRLLRKKIKDINNPDATNP